MTARGGLGSAFAAAVGEWPAASKQVVRVTAAPDGGWRVLATAPVPLASTDVLDVPVPPAVADVVADPVSPAATGVRTAAASPAATDVPGAPSQGPVAG